MYKLSDLLLNFFLTMTVTNELFLEVGKLHPHKHLQLTASSTTFFLILQPADSSSKH